MNIDELRKKLHEGEVVFSYTKKDGSTRKARGTLNGGLIPSEHWPKNEGYESSPDVQRYYDVDAGGWRSFLVENLIDVEGVEG